MFKNKVALVTGGTSGIGFGIAKRFLENGADVIALYKSNDMQAKKAQEQLSKYGKYTVAKVDVADEKSMQQFFSGLSKLDYLINCAGMSNEADFVSLSMQKIREVFDVLVFGKMIACKCAYPLLIKSSTPKVVNIASRFASRPFVEGVALSSSEAAIVMFTKNLALEWASRGINVNCVSPSLTVDTGSYSTFYKPEDAEAVGKKNPSGRLGKLEDTADAVLFLCSDASSYITGENLNVNGGILLV